MPYAVDNNIFQRSCRQASKLREGFRAGLRLEHGRAVVLFAAKYIPVKAPQDLLEAQLDVRQHWYTREPPYTLFVGDGPLRAELEARAKRLADGDVRFLGFRNQSELPALYDLCDVLCSHVISSHGGWLSTR
jgi:glycosyltransferase involved in cell wall biosynthesis